MNKRNVIKMLVCCIMLMILGYTSHVRSALDGTDESMLDAVGKKDPFRMVTPIIEAKKNILRKISGSKTNTTMGLETKPDLYVETVMLKFLRAGNLERVVSNLTSDFGVVTVDKETNSLIICDGEQNLGRIVAEIRKADQTPKQILIEVVIVDVQLNDDTEIGVDWGSYNFRRDDTKHTFSSTVMSNLTAAGALGGSFTLVQEGLDITIKALQATRDVEILASPRVLVVSGQEAILKTTEEIPYTEFGESTSAGGTDAFAITTTKFKEAGITLRVIATLTDEQKILIAINAEQSINAGTDSSVGSAVPVVDKRSATTTLLMSDGQVLVMGGLRKKETTLTQSKVPLLGDLPFVGFLFSNDKTVVKNSELLVFISPHIYPDGPLDDEQMERFNELRNVPMLRLPKERLEYEAIDEVIPSYLEE